MTGHSRRCFNRILRKNIRWGCDSGAAREDDVNEKEYVSWRFKEGALHEHEAARGAYAMNDVDNFVDGGRGCIGFV